MNIFTVLWVVIGVVVLVVEAVAVGRKEHGDTITDHVRYLMRNKWFRVTFGLFWAWLTLHFFVPDLGL